MDPGGFAVAVVGLAIRAPGADGADTFWRNLRDGRESVTWFGSRSGPSHPSDGEFIPAGGIVDRPEHFDARFFGWSPGQAVLTDPQHRLFLEVAWEAFENAGIVPGPGRRTGVFAGAGFPSYLWQMRGEETGSDPATQVALLVGNDKDHIATRTAHALNLRGPAVTLQTACSTSLVCVHAACQSLLSGEIDTALAGGATIIFPTDRGYFYFQDGILSPDGHCRPFDAAASGTVPASAVAGVVLRRLEDATRDGDPIRAVIRSTAVNNDGAEKMSYTAPSVAGQSDVIAEALRLAGLTGRDISYVEAHGTATALGDPIEIAALDRAMPRSDDDTAVCYLGSVKSNIGHTDVAAGAVGLIKTVLALENELIPATLHITQPSGQLGLEQTRFMIAGSAVHWPRSNRPRRAGVSSFGLGGTNAHAIVEEAPPGHARTASEIRLPVLVSAGTADGVEDFAHRLADRIEHLPAAQLPGACATLAFGRRPRPYRRAEYCATPEEAISRLCAPRPAIEAMDQPRIAFAFPGAGHLEVPHIRELMTLEDFARGYSCAADACRAAGAEFPDPPAPDGPGLTRPLVALPMLFATQIGLTWLWAAYGIRPAAVLGHSAGEYAAACAAGVMDLNDAAAMVVKRAQLLESAVCGGMVAIRFAAESAEHLAREWGLSLAVINTPTNVVLSGAAEPLQEFVRFAESSDLNPYRVPIDCPAHSPLLHDAARILTGFASSISLAAPRLDYISSTTGKSETEAVATAGYWGRHLHEPVRFADAVKSLRVISDVILEVGPGATIAGYIAEPGSRRPSVIQSLPHPSDPTPAPDALAGAAAAVWELGAPLAWEALIDAATPRVALPSASFQGPRYTAADKDADSSGLPIRELGQPLVHEPFWQSGEPSIANQAALAQAGWTVFDNGSELADRVVEGLVEAGTQLRRITAAELRQEAGGVNLDSVRAWLNGLLQDGWGGRVLYCVPAKTTAGPGEEDLRRRLSFAVPMMLAGILGEHSGPARLVSLGHDLFSVLGTETADPVANLVLGPTVVAAREYGNLTTRVIDAPADVAGQAVVNLVLAELTDTAPHEVSALRGARRWIRYWRKVPLVSAAEESLPDSVLITGGLGGIGLCVAKCLVERGVKRIALLSRTGLSDCISADGEGPSDTLATGRAQAVSHLEASGARVLVVKADVSRPDEVAAAVAQVAKDFGRISAVIHAAGIAGGGLIRVRDLGTCERLLAPKIDGIQALATALSRHPVRSVQIYSALDAILGTPGQADHVSANAFLDAVPSSGMFGDAIVTAINWGAWRDVGQAAELYGTGSSGPWRASLPVGMPASVAAAAAVNLLTASAPNLAVSTCDVDQLLARVRAIDLEALAELQVVAPQDERQPRPLPPGSYVAPADDIEELVAGVWAGVLGLAQVGVQDNYFALGGQSLAAIQIATQLRARFPFAIGLADLLARPTVAEQAGWLADEIESYVSSLSDDEVQQQLSARPKLCQEP
jgi:phthiocerol/phenolphthiocerol synthesis type-I polyketide synthase E